MRTWRNGRRWRLKIFCPLGVRVQVPPSAPAIKNPRQSGGLPNSMLASDRYPANPHRGENIKQSALNQWVVGSNSSRRSASRDWNQIARQCPAGRAGPGHPHRRGGPADLERQRIFPAIDYARNGLGPDLKIALIALTLNVALILFGWRRYVDLQHEAEMRKEGEARAALIASTDGMTGLLNRKGFADRGEELAPGGGRPRGNSWSSFRCSSTASRRSTTATAMTSATRCCG